MHKNNNKIKSVLAFATLALGVSTIALSSSLAVNAEYKPDLNRYEDALSSTSKEAVYNYNYENTSADAAPGYFELSLEKLSGAKPSDLIEIKSITETSPIDYATKKPAADAKTTEFKVSDAVYKDGDTLKIRISPQSECKVRTEGGCDQGSIPAAVPAKISIKIALKDGAPTDPSVIFGSGRIYFPNGYDVNQIGWKINVGQADETKVTIPTIKDEPVDTAALDTNATLAQTGSKDSTPTDSPATTDENRPADLQVGKETVMPKTDQVKTPAANTQTMALDQDSKKPEVNNNLIFVVSAIVGIAILAGAGLFFLNKQNQAKKVK
jgi:hypothetical protein